MKKVISIILGITILLSAMPVVAFAEESVDITTDYNSIVQQYDSDKQYIDNIVLTTDSDTLELNGAKIPVATGISEEEDITMISVETLCKYIDAEYSEETKKTTGYSTITFADREVWFNETTGAIDIVEGYNDNIVVLDNYPIVKDDTVMVPLKEFSDALGYDVTQSEEDENKFLLTRPYQTSRLLVSTKKKNIDPLNAVAEARDEENDITILQFDSETDAMEAEEYYSSLKGVTVEPDVIMSSCEDAEICADIFDINNDHNDTLASDTINIDDMLDYLETQPLSDITVAVVDTGVCSTHPDLKDRVICADVNFSDSEQKNSEDDEGHGTHVTGIIIDNSLDNVNVLAVKVLNADGKGTIYQIYQGIEYAASQGAKVINLSLGAYGESELLTNCIKNLWDKNITVVAASGNNNWFAHEFTPGGIPECITVGAGKAGEGRFEHDLGAHFSNAQYPVDVSAPGVDIYSTYLFNDEYDGYRSMTGTSMAAPFVTAVAGMLYSYDKSYTSKYVHEQIKNNYQEDFIIHNNLVYWDREKKEYSWVYGYLDCSNLIDCNRTATPVPDCEPGYYTDFIDLELNCADEDAEIYYTIDGTRASKENGILYTEPIPVENPVRINAVAYSEGKFKSLQARYDYYVVKLADESAFTINSKGIITSFDNTVQYADYLKVPDTINGITVRGIGEKALRGSIRVLHLPDTCEELYDDAFYGCNFYGIIARGVKYVGNRAFRNKNLCKNFQLGELEYIGEQAFENSSIKSINGEDLTEISDSAFKDSSLQSAYLPNVEYIGDYAFTDTKLQEFSADNVVYIGKNAFEGIPLSSITLPNLEEMGESAFEASCLVSVNLESLNNTIPERAFCKCSRLIDVNIPNATQLEYMSLYGCKNIRDLVMNKVITIGGYALTKCNNLSNIQLESVERLSGFSGAKVEMMYFPNLVQLGGMNSDYLKYLYLPKCETITEGITAPNLEDVYLPKCETIVKGFTAPNLKNIYLPELKMLGDKNKYPNTMNALFTNCYALEQIDLPKLEYCYGYIIDTDPHSNYKLCALKRINAPNIISEYKLPTIGDYIYVLLRFVFFSQIEYDESSNILSVDAGGFNLQYDWYYSESGEEDSFSLISTGNERSIITDKKGYYYVDIIQHDFKSISTKTSDVFNLSDNNKVQETKNIRITGNCQFSVLASDKTYKADNSDDSYEIDIDVPKNETVIITCDDPDFKYWVSKNNRIVSVKNSYRFKATDDLQLICKSYLSGIVSFYNGNGDLISSSEYTSFNENDYPVIPEMYGHHFVKWSKTVDEINDALQNGESIDVTAIFEKDIKYYSLDLQGGYVVSTNSDKENGTNSFREFSYVKIKPSYSNMPFFCWKDENNNVISYLEEYIFYMSNDTKIYAVYTDDKLDKDAITRITNAVIDKENRKITFISEYEIPDGNEGISHGIIMTNNSELDENTFVIGANDVLKGTSVKNEPSGTYTLYKSNVKDDEIWYARSYVTYTNKLGKTKTKYSSIYSATLEQGKED